MGYLDVRQQGHEGRSLTRQESPAMHRSVRQPWHTLHEWEKVNSRVVAAGSQAQAANVLEMALQDLIWALGQLEAAGVRLDPKPIDTPIIFRHKAQSDQPQV